ncbi:MAG: thioredoxin fold domain-containing protein [Rhodoferax sp.]|nr:thioredoxin fold domain-containing protein [Rhodoferax sp.]
MKRYIFVLSLCAALTLALTACSKQESTTESSTKSAAASKPADPLQAVASQGKGFTVGAMMSAQTVYVMFDPQCPHCGHLWEASKPLHKKVKFVWVPVAIINGKSGPQGAALLSAANPTELMSTHEQSILANQGGIAASASVSPEIEAAIKQNTQLFTSMQIDSVPYILAKNARTGQVVTNNGAMTTAALADFVGVDQP